MLVLAVVGGERGAVFHGEWTSGFSARITSEIVFAYREAGFELLSSQGGSTGPLINKEVALFTRHEKAFRTLAKLRVIPRRAMPCRSG